MKRYFSHYTFIYPNIYLKNHVIETDDEKIVQAFPFDKEIAMTEFYSGLLLFVPPGIEFDNKIEVLLRKNAFLSNASDIIFQDRKYNVIHDENFVSEE
ncbi:MAG: hypothetical protein LBN74_05480 [Prevotella sp.]|jgi:hypothetical protein|nr:hypothetical protein [Prevotella sp.]